MEITEKSLDRIMSLGVVLTMIAAGVAIFGAFNPEQIEITAAAAIIAMVGTVVSHWSTSAIKNRSDLKVAKINSTAEAANSKAEALKKENIQLQILLEREQYNRLMLEQKVGPRSLSQQEAERIRQFICNIKGQSTVLTNSRRDPETLRYAEQIRSTLEAASIIVKRTDESHLIVAGAPQSGIYVIIHAGIGSREIEDSFRLLTAPSVHFHKASDPRTDIAAHIFFFEKPAHT